MAGDALGSVSLAVSGSVSLGSVASAPESADAAAAALGRWAGECTGCALPLLAVAADPWPFADGTVSAVVDAEQASSVDDVPFAVVAVVASSKAANGVVSSLSADAPADADCQAGSTIGDVALNWDAILDTAAKPLQSRLRSFACNRRATTAWNLNFMDSKA